MKKIFKILGLLLLQFSVLSIVVLAQEGGKLYKTYCAGCHGANLEGNSASSLIKTEWKYGRSTSLMIRNITFGIPETEMIAWNQVLSTEQIKSLVDFISEAQKIQPNINRSIPKDIQTEKYDLKIEEWVIDAIKTPWALEFVSKNRALVSERRGMLRWIVEGTPSEDPIKGVPQSQEVDIWILPLILNIKKMDGSIWLLVMPQSVLLMTLLLP